MDIDLPPGHCNAEDILCSLPGILLPTEEYSFLSSTNKLIYHSGFFCNYSSLYVRMRWMFLGILMWKENYAGCWERGTIVSAKLSE